MYQISPSNWMMMYYTMLTIMSSMYYMLNCVEKNSIMMLKKIKIYVK
nr:ATP synthase F0 subunit 8 [Stigmaeopsis miscanthi]